MFQDINQSKETLATFEKENQSGKFVQGVEFNIQVLTSGHWPFSAAKKMELPSVMRNIQMTFANYYTKKFSNRQLVWLYDKGSLTLQATFLDKPYMAEVTVIQAAMLKLFDDRDEMTVKEMIDTLGIDLSTLR